MMTYLYIIKSDNVAIKLGTKNPSDDIQVGNIIPYLQFIFLWI